MRRKLKQQTRNQPINTDTVVTVTPTPPVTKVAHLTAPTSITTITLTANTTELTDATNPNPASQLKQLFPFLKEVSALLFRLAFVFQPKHLRQEKVSERE